MFGQIWRFLFGDLSSTEISALIAAIGFCINQISTWLSRKFDDAKTIADDAITDAIVTVSKNEGVSLNVSNDIPIATGEELLQAATDLAVVLGKNRGVDVTKVLGGTDGVKAATQTTFKRIKNFFKN